MAIKCENDKLQVGLKEYWEKFLNKISCKPEIIDPTNLQDCIKKINKLL